MLQNGEWKYEVHIPHGSADAEWRVVAGDGSVIATADPEMCLEDPEAIARLMAAAPKLLATVKSLAWFIENVTEDDPERSRRFFEVREAWRDVIAEAEGQS